MMRREVWKFDDELDDCETALRSSVTQRILDSL